MSLGSAFASAEYEHRQVILEDAWGHLAPRKNITYRGHITFAVGCFGDDELNPTALEVELVSRKYGELSSSPWFYDALSDLLSNWACDGRHGATKKLPATWPTVEAGGAYRWEGVFKNYEFVGTLRRLKLGD